MSAETKAVVTVAEMARMVSLSRARFYQLMGTAFPLPVYDVSTRRPIYVEELQKVCLEVRRRNCGIDGKPVLFYTRRTDLPVSVAARRSAKRIWRPKDEHADLIEDLRCLGLVSVNTADVQNAVKMLFPTGIAGVDRGEVIRTVFVHLKRQNTGDNVGR